MSDVSNELENRVLLLAPTVQDGEFTAKLFREANIATHICHSLYEVATEMRRGAAMVIISMDVQEPDDLSIFSKTLMEQPAWSDLPILLLVSPGSNGLLYSDRLQELHSVTYLKRPVEVVALLSAVQSGLRDRRRQYAMREHLEEREKQSQALLDADRRKDEFLATLAHELRNPLSPLRSGIDLLRMECDDKVERQSILQMMDRQLGQMVRLVDDLLDVSRITRDKLVVEHELIDIQSVIKASIDTTRQMLNNARITLQTTIPSYPVFVRGDAVRLTQVVSNLLNNAAKYSEESSQIELVVETTQDEVIISVTDHGVGIPPDRLEDVFEMFTQVDSSITRARGGLGIGLTLVRRIVEMHAGKVTALSEGPGKGSQFRVVLPRATDVSHSRLTDVGTTRPTPAKRILVVDDTQAARIMLAKLLLKLGHEVYEAKSAAEALQLIETVRPEVIISDIGMPEMDGYALAKALRKLKCCEKSLLVALTGYGQEVDRQLAIESGFDLHLVKPVTYAVLEQTLSTPV